MHVRDGDGTPFCAMRAKRLVTHPGAEVLLKFCSEFCLVVFAAVSWF